MDNSIHVIGFIKSIIYDNPTNGFKILILDDGKNELTVKGSFLNVSVGEKIEVTGIEEEHPVYGPQIKMTEFSPVALEEISEVEIYLGSGAIKGVGEKLAARIISAFGEDTIRIMEEEPERLAEIKGISERMARDIGTQVIEKKSMRRVMSFLLSLGISNTFSVKIYDVYKDSAIDIISENPYRLATDIEGIGFKKADEIASKIGTFVNPEYRMQSGIFYVLSEALAEGNTCLPEEELLKRSSELLGIPVSELDVAITNLMAEGDVTVKGEADGMFVYHIASYRAESKCAAILDKLAVPLDRYEGFDEDAEEKIQRIEKMMDITLDKLQREAVMAAAKNGVSVITGGPGTGKTTTVKAIIKFFETRNSKVVLAAPTGRAAKRLSETSGMDASTIHRLLEVKGSSRYRANFGRNEDNPIEADVVIIDEMSMVDIFLFDALLSALDQGTILILIGDSDQLPSVGPGNVLGDLIKSECLPVIKFNKVFRQSEESGILLNAHRIREGEDIVCDNDKEGDFFFVNRDEAARLSTDIVNLVSDILPRNFHCKPEDVQVLTPMRKGSFGSVALNSVLQSSLNPPSKSKREWAYGDTVFRVGDKVMQIKNNYDLSWEITGNFGLVTEKGEGVFNGDIGKIKSINDYAGYMEVEFEDGRSVMYGADNLEELELAYAITIHKSQGSEYGVVVLPLFAVSSNLRYRNLLYTGVTRAKECAMILGSRTILEDMIHGRDANVRYSGFEKRLKERFAFDH